MQGLEKILEEINAEFDRHIGTRLKIIAGTNDDVYRYGYGKSLEAYQQGKLFVEDIIRKNMNDGWIPSKKHLPKAPEMEDEYPEFNVMIEGAKTPTTLQYTHEGIWVDDYGNVYNVIAWQPLPEPYKPKPQNKPEEHYPEWRTKLLNKFDRRE